MGRPRSIAWVAAAAAWCLAGSPVAAQPAAAPPAPPARAPAPSSAPAPAPTVYLPHLKIAVAPAAGWRPAFFTLGKDTEWRDAFYRVDGDLTTKLSLVPGTEPCARVVVDKPAWLGGGTAAPRPAFVPAGFHPQAITVAEGAGDKRAALWIPCIDLGGGRSLAARVLVTGPRAPAAGDPGPIAAGALLSTVVAAVRGAPPALTTIKLPESGNTIALPAVDGWTARKVRKRGKEMVDQLTRAAPATTVTIDWEPRACAADRRPRSTAVVPLRMPRWEGGYQDGSGARWTVSFCTDEMTVSAWVVFTLPAKPDLDFPLTAYTVLSAIDRGIGRLTPEEEAARKKKEAEDADWGF